MVKNTVLKIHVSLFRKKKKKKKTKRIVRASQRENIVEVASVVGYFRHTL